LQTRRWEDGDITTKEVPSMATTQNIASRRSRRNGVVMPRSNEALATIACSSVSLCETAEKLKELALRVASATDDDYDQALIDIAATLRETKHHPEKSAA
jgi:hypothetical protein